MTTPKFQHDCKSCTFLGRAEYGDQVYDLYYCTQGGVLPTLIARYSDKGSEYISGIGFSEPYMGIDNKIQPPHPAMAMARLLALSKGLPLSGKELRDAAHTSLFRNAGGVEEKLR